MIIAHDLGTTGNKATLVDSAGTIVAAVTVHYGTDFSSGGKAEQNPEDWWKALCSATRTLLANSGVKAVDIAGVSFSGQMMGAVLLDAAGIPVRPAIIWADTRSSVQAAQLTERIGLEEAYRITGHRLNPTYSISKVMWVRDNEPEVYSRARHLVLAKDYMIFRLTGEILTDPSDASSTNAFDQGAHRWSEDIISATGLSTDLFPVIVESATVAGTISAEAASACGLLAGTPVVVGGGDGPMAALGSGIVDEASGPYAYLGSSSWVSLSSDRPLHDPLMRTMTFNHVIPGRYVPTATMQAGGASLQWIADVLAPDERGRFERLLGGAAEVAASDDGLFFLPHLLGERSPYWDPNVRATFVGLARHHGQEHLTRAVVEGVAFNLHTCLKAFRENGAKTDRVDVIGGAANSIPLLQILSDVWGVSVRRRALVDEATALGAAIVGGVGVGLFESFDIASTLSTYTAELEPDEAAHRRYENEHPRFIDAYRRLESWFSTSDEVVVGR
ncbi:xylulokinase [Rhodococcus globerulus]|uniref:Xylulose kinase n=1 Tax=Rhodococcus globerulus TaxID=33008 RepID=A0ABU4C2Z3_RHOGO|nr:xylulokinase [Rhodococcus globerulus]MDV6270868.1 xylulokinase [Rhodococcus globerulus]